MDPFEHFGLFKIFVIKLVKVTYFVHVESAIYFLSEIFRLLFPVFLIRLTVVEF
jgi:hypothetical protein